MSSSHFYLTLPSNASTSTFPDNKASSYRVKIPQPLNLNGDWEVGLYSITYPHTWYNFSEHDGQVYYSDDGVIFFGNYVDYGYYETMEDFLKSVNKAILKETKGNNV